MEVFGQNNTSNVEKPTLPLSQFVLKEVIGMLLIEQIYEPNNIRSDYVRCPACKRGRLCDKPVGEKAMAIAIQGATAKTRNSRIILKCPRCSQKFVISFTKE